MLRKTGCLTSEASRNLRPASQSSRASVVRTSRQQPHTPTKRAACSPAGIPALSIGVEIPEVLALHNLRDEVLSGDFENAVNQALALTEATQEVQVDKTLFLELYEQSLLSMEKLTDHQKQALHAMQGATHVHLAAVAGAGKTFLAVHRVLRELATPSARVLYVSPSPALGFHVIQWLAMRLATSRQGHMNSWIERVGLLHSPYTAILWPSITDGRIVCKGNPSMPHFQLVVVDEAHSVFRPDAAAGLLHSVRYDHLLLCSDDSQSSAVEQTYPSWRDIKTVKLREVVRSTKRIVAGAAAFRLDSDLADVATALSTDGPPLKSFLFASPEPSQRFEEYAKQIITALWHVVHNFPGTSLHKRVALLAPDDAFCLQLRPILQQRLRHELPHRNLNLMDFKESLSSLPEGLQQAGPAQPTEHLVMDSMQNAEGLEQLVVICVGLDAPIRSSHVDLETRAQLYKALSRAQMLAIVVNEHVEGGWLEFLSVVQFQEAKLKARRKPQSQKLACC